MLVSNESLRSEIKSLARDAAKQNNANIAKITEVLSESKQLKQEAIQEAKISETFLKEQNPVSVNESRLILDCL